MSPAVAGQTCWQCQAPAQREKQGVGACQAHLLPNRAQRRELRKGGHAAPTPVTTAPQSRPTSQRDTSHRTAAKPKRVVKAAVKVKARWPEHYTAGQIYAVSGNSRYAISPPVPDELCNPPIWERVRLYQEKYGDTPAQRDARERGASYSPPTVPTTPLRKRGTHQRSPINWKAYYARIG